MEFFFIYSGLRYLLSSKFGVTILLLLVGLLVGVGFFGFPHFRLTTTLIASVIVFLLLVKRFITLISK